MSEESEKELEKNMNKYLKSMSQKLGSAQVVAAKVITVTEERVLEILDNMTKSTGARQPNARISWDEAHKVRREYELMIREVCKEHADDLLRAGYIEARGDIPMLATSFSENKLILAYQLGEWDFRPIMVQGEHEE